MSVCMEAGMQALCLQCRGAWCLSCLIWGNVEQGAAQLLVTASQLL